MNEFLQICLSMPVVPFSVLLVLCAIYWCLVILGGVQSEVFDYDLNLDFDSNLETSVVDWGMVSLRWLNLGDVPLMLWLSTFAITGWGTTMFLDQQLALLGGGVDSFALACGRTLLVGAFGAKVLTQPFKGRLKHREPNPAEELVGKQVVITSTEVTPDFGQAEYSNGEGAPLRLHVRSYGTKLFKGDTAEIVEYATDRKLFYVSAPSAAQADL